MGEPAAAEPIRIFVGLESALTEYERRDLALGELQRTIAFDRQLLMIISPTGTGYVNYAAVEAAEYMTRGNIASVAMQYSLRPSALSLDRVAEGRQQYRMLIDAIHNQLAERPADERPRVVLFGESLGAWTSQDAFQHRGTQGLVDAGIDRAIWAKGHDYRADVARFVREVYALQASYEQLASIERALRASELQRKALLSAHDPKQG